MKSSHTGHTSHTATTAARTKAHADTEADTEASAAAIPVAAPSVPASIAATPAPAAPKSGGGVPFIARPPAGAKLPVRPEGWVPRAGEDYRGTQPKKAELSTLSSAIDDLKRFSADYASVLGATAPPLDHVLQLFEAGNEWSAQRVATANWDVYAQAREGLAWGGIRNVMDTLRPAFDLAVKGNSALAIKLPGLASLLGAQKVIARKGASTRRANKTQEEAGELPTHGKVGKARNKAAAKVALSDAKQTAGTATQGQAATANGGVASDKPATAPASTTSTTGSTAS